MSCPKDTISHHSSHSPALTFIFIYLSLFYVYGCFACIYLCDLHVGLEPEESEETVRFQETGFRDGCKLP